LEELAKYHTGSLEQGTTQIQQQAKTAADQLAELSTFHTGELGQQEATRKQQAEQASAALKELETYHKGEIEHGQKSLDVQERMRGAASKASMQEQLIQSLTPSIAAGQMPLSVLADTLRRGGSKELADTLDTARAADVQRKAAAHLTNINALRQKGDTKNLATVMSSLDQDPEVAAAVRAKLPAEQYGPPTAPRSGAEMLGAATRNIAPLAVAPYGAVYATAKPFIPDLSKLNWEDVSKAAKEYYKGLTQ
jgi:hypothetical protein